MSHFSYVTEARMSLTFQQRPVSALFKIPMT